MTGDQSAPMNDAGVELHLARHGKLSYVEFPASDPARSAAFYQTVFAWSVESRSAERVSFQDGARDLIGAFVTGRGLAGDSGVLPYLYVDRIDAAIEAITSNGCEVVEVVRPEGDLWVAKFRDPGGNVVGVWQSGERG